jgi:hypothetical protein
MKRTARDILFMQGWAAEASAYLLCLRVLTFAPGRQ